MRLLLSSLCDKSAVGTKKNKKIRKKNVEVLPEFVRKPQRQLDRCESEKREKKLKKC